MKEPFLYLNHNRCTQNRGTSQNTRVHEGIVGYCGVQQGVGMGAFPFNGQGEGYKYISYMWVWTAVRVRRIQPQGMHTHVPEMYTYPIICINTFAYTLYPAIPHKTHAT